MTDTSAGPVTTAGPGDATPDRAAHQRRHRFGYWTVAVTFVILQAFLTVPSPLYGRYAVRDGLSSLTITLIYAAYAVGVAVSLVLVGHLSDVLGRRPLLFLALGLDTVSTAVFLLWPDQPGLYLARVVCGLAVGVTASTATAYLTELHLAHRPGESVARAQLTATVAALGGLGLGGLYAGLLAEYVGHPLTLPYLVQLGLFLLCTIGLAATPETRPRTVPRPPYRPQRLAVPPRSRGAFVSAMVGVALQFAVMGLFVGLAGTFLTGTLHRTSLALAGACVFVVFLAGGLSAVVTAKWSLGRLVGLAVAGMLVGLGLLALAAWLPTPSLTLFLLSGAVIGAGGAALFKSSLMVVIAISPREKLAETLASFFLAGYLGLSIPVIGIGIALQHTSTRGALLGFAVAIAACVLAATPTLSRPQVALASTDVS